MCLDYLEPVSDGAGTQPWWAWLSKPGAVNYTSLLTVYAFPNIQKCGP